MQCAYCKEELLEGASACRACTRKQPIAPETMQNRVNIGLVVAVLIIIIGGATFSVWSASMRDAEINRIVARARLCGQHDVSDAFIKLKIDQLRDEGVSWRDAEKAVEGEVCPEFPPS